MPHMLEMSNTFHAPRARLAHRAWLRRRRPLRLVLAVFAFAAALAWATGAFDATFEKLGKRDVPAGAVYLGTCRVVDGDTCDLATGSARVARTLRVRLHGIDTPERGERGGTAATEFLRSLLGEGAAARRLRCQATGDRVDGFGRLLARCTLPDGRDVGLLLVEHGLARAFRRYSLDYAAAEERAKAAGLGIWGAQQ